MPLPASLYKGTTVTPFSSDWVAIPRYLGGVLDNVCGQSFSCVMFVDHVCGRMRKESEVCGNKQNQEKICAGVTASMPGLDFDDVEMLG